MSDLATFISVFLARGGVGTNSVNSGQCVGLVELWLRANGKPQIGGNAKDLMAMAPRLVFKVTNNTPVNYPKPGNIICWGPAWGGGFGHTAVVIAANANRVVTFEQNDPLGAPCWVATHDYTAVAGWIGW